MGLKSRNVILTCTPSDQTFSKQGATTPLSAQFFRPAAWTGDATPKTSVKAATVVAPMRTRTRLNFDTSYSLNYLRSQPPDSLGADLRRNVAGIHFRLSPRWLTYRVTATG